MMSNLFQALMSGPAPVIAKTELENGLEVSTVDSPDCGPETALVDAYGAYPVERYEDEEKAKEGHARWVETAKGLAHGSLIVQIGWMDEEDTEEISLRLDKEPPPSEADRLEQRHGTPTILGPDYETREAQRAYQNDEPSETEARACARPNKRTSPGGRLGSA